MAKKIDWLYRRKSCLTCKKADAYLANAEVQVGEIVDAAKTRLGPADALKLVGSAEKLVAARGKSVKFLDLKAERPADEALLAYLIGPTGNLRAPTARVGKTLLVGFHDDAYKQVLGV